MKKLFLPAIFLAATAAMSVTPAAFSEPIIYQGVRYQYGTRGEIYYGGLYPQYLPTTFPVRNTPATQALANHFGFPNPNTRLTIFNGPEGDFPRLVYSDLVPFGEAGRLGFTIDDARNEAYLNVPRYFRGNEAPKPAVRPAARTPQQERAKAIPLLSWARSESAKGNPALQRALLHEAGKYAPEEAAKARVELGL